MSEVQYSYEPIETAPKDGRCVKISGYCETSPNSAEGVEGEGYWEGYWSNGWVCDLPRGYVIMHWLKPVALSTQQDDLG